MSRSEMSDRKSIICKRNVGETEFEGSSIKRMRLDDDDSADSDVLRSLERTVSSSLADSASNSGGFSAASSEEDDHRSSSISSGCSSNGTNEIATDTRLPFLDLEADQISETEILTLITNNFRKTAKKMESASATATKTERRKPEKIEKAPTQAELEDFFSAAERCEQKRFTEKYNYDIVNDTPLEGRYQWVSLKP